MRIKPLLANAVLALLIFVIGQQQALADKYPTKPVKIIVPLSPGGASDTNARIVAAELSKRLGQQFIVDNRTGAGGSIGTAIAAKAKPDGYTILWVSNTNMVVSSQLYNVKYNTLRDFVPLALVTRANNVLYVNNSVPVKSAKELIALAKKKPGELFYSSSGNGSTVHMSFELFKTATGIDVTHVPHKGGKGSVLSVLNGQAQTAIHVATRVAKLAKAGKVRPLGVTGDIRSPLLPKIPTLKELGIDVEIWLWGGFIAPKGTPKAIVEKLSSEILDIVKMPSVKKKFAERGSEAWPMDSKQFRKFSKSEYVKWGKAIKASGAKID